MFSVLFSSTDGPSQDFLATPESPEESEDHQDECDTNMSDRQNLLQSQHNPEIAVETKVYKSRYWVLFIYSIILFVQVRICHSNIL